MRALLSRREKREVYFSHLEAEKCRFVCLLILISDMYLNLEKALKKSFKNNFCYCSEKFDGHALDFHRFRNL